MGKMNLPNKLTTIRMILVPVFAAVLLAGLHFDPLHETEYRIIADLIFIMASLTDLLDGKIARARNLVTNYGKFMDPLADKLLTCTAFIALIELGQIPAWIVMIIIGREFIISGFRLIAATNGKVIAANYWGKFKTTFQMLTIIIMVADFDNPAWYWLGQICMWAALILTVISLMTYIIQNKDVLKDQD